MGRLAGCEPGAAKAAEPNSLEQEKTIARYPEPKLPIRPILSFASFTGKADAGLPSVEDAGQCIRVTSGRIATALGLQFAGIKSGDEVLLPAYYCSSMVDAIEAVSAVPVFYKCRADLSVDMNNVASRITERTRALLAAHYFGFPQEMVGIREYCDEQGLVLIEDCAHAYFGHYRGNRLGAYGDFAITSEMKFFPVSDGGTLIFPQGKERQISLQSGGSGFEAKSVINDIERSVGYGRLQPFNLLLKLPLLLKDWIWRSLKWLLRYFGEKSLSSNGNYFQSLGPDSSYGGYGFDKKWMHVRMSRFSQYLIGRLPRARIIEIRRRNFKRLLDALSSCKNAQPFYASLPDGVVPYAFPLLISNVDEVFPVLKREGIPILRWEDIDQTACEVSSRYAKELLQLPCHQEITEKELEWMISRIQSVLNSAQ